MSEGHSFLISSFEDSSNYFLRIRLILFLKLCFLGFSTLFLDALFFSSLDEEFELTCFAEIELFS
jgi:hypothetical protein